MAYPLHISKAQIQAIITALKVPPPNPQDVQGLDVYNLEFLVGALEDTLTFPEDSEMIHGICL